jgi:hypothetical protein
MPEGFVQVPEVVNVCTFAVEADTQDQVGAEVPLDFKYWPEVPAETNAVAPLPD